MSILQSLECVDTSWYMLYAGVLYLLALASSGEYGYTSKI